MVSTASMRMCLSMHAVFDVSVHACNYHAVIDVSVHACNYHAVPCSI